MDPLTVTAAAAMRSRLDALSVVSNNLANAGSSGFKLDREHYASFQTSWVERELGAPTEAPVADQVWTDFSQGSLQATGSPYDLAILGRGFFGVKGPGDETVYTRNGGFRVSVKGELVSTAGFQLLGVDQRPISVSADLPLTVASNGVVSQGGKQVGQIGIFDFASLDRLAKVEGGWFRNPDKANLKAAAGDVRMEQGKLELSNVSVPEAAAKLISITRQFEMIQRAISLGSEMNRRAVEEVSRVTG